MAKVCQVHLSHVRFLHQGDGAEVAHEVGKALAGLLYGQYALLVGSALYVGVCQIGLADAAYGRGGIHYLVCQHTGQFLPRLHLLLCGKHIYVPAQVVQRLLHGTLAEEQSSQGQAEGEVAVSHRLAHQVSTVA